MKFRARCAGHEFNDDCIDSQCTLVNAEGERCWMTRSHLFRANDSDVNNPGFSHVPPLSFNEYAEIKAERAAYEEHCERVMVELRSVCAL